MKMKKLLAILLALAIVIVLTPLPSAKADEGRPSRECPHCHSTMYGDGINFNCSHCGSGFRYNPDTGFTEPVDVLHQPDENGLCRFCGIPCPHSAPEDGYDTAVLPEEGYDAAVLPEEGYDATVLPEEGYDAAVLPGQPEPAELSWDQVEEAASGYPGSVRSLGAYSLGMYIPDSFRALETEDKSEGSHTLLLLEDDAGHHIAIIYTSLKDSDVNSLLEINGASDVVEIAVNGIPAIRYILTTAEGNETSNLLFSNESENTVLIIGFSPMDTDEFRTVTGIIMASVQLIAVEE